MMTYIGCEERVREKERGEGRGERFLPHIKVFTCLCSASTFPMGDS